MLINPELEWDLYQGWDQIGLCHVNVFTLQLNLSCIPSHTHKKAFQQDAYRPFRWPALDVSTGAGRYLVSGKPPPLYQPPERDLGPEIPTPERTWDKRYISPPPLPRDRKIPMKTSHWVRFA